MPNDKKARFLAHRDLFDDLRHPVCLVEPDGTVAYSNPAFRRYAEPVLGDPVFRTVAGVPSAGVRLEFVHDPSAGRLTATEVPPEDWQEGVDTICHPCRFADEAGRETAVAYHFYEQSSIPASFLQETLRQLDTVHKIKSDFLTRVTHELNTPLTAILGFAEILLDPSDLDSDSIREFCREIWQGSRRIHAIVSDILNLTRLEAGLFEYHRETGDLGDVVASTIEAFADEYELKGVRLEADLAPEREVLKFDRERIRDVVARFLSNALTHSEPGSRVVVRTRIGETEVSCQVQDEGRGLDPADLDRVFEEFSQIEDIQHHQVGLGIGLTLARRVVEEGHGGRMWAESEGRGRGATFHFSLPRYRVG